MRSRPISLSSLTPSAIPVIALAAVAITWGVTFAVVDDTTAALPPADLVTWRFGLGTVALGLLRRTMRAKPTVAAIPPMPAVLRWRAIALGALLGSGFLLQTWGLTYTDAFMSGFLTSLLVVIAPVAGWLMFRDRVPAATWLGIGVATAGLMLLSLRSTGFGPGQLLTLAAAVVWGLHVVLLSRWAKPEYAIDLAQAQAAVVTGLALALVGLRAACARRAPTLGLPPDGRSWLSVLFLGLVASAAAMVLMSWSQARVSATRTAMIFTLEPAVAGLTAALTGTMLTVRTIAGGALVLSALYLVEQGTRRQARRDRLSPPQLRPYREVPSSTQ